MPATQINGGALSLVLHFDDLNRTRESLIQLEVAAQLAQRVLDKAETHGVEAAIQGVRDIFRATALLMG